MSFLSYVRDISEMHFCASQSFSYQVNPQGLLFIHSSHFALWDSLASTESQKNVSLAMRVTELLNVCPHSIVDDKPLRSYMLYPALKIP